MTSKRKQDGHPDDPVNHPSHYISDSGLEAVEVIEAFAVGNAHRSQSLKYLLRAGRKGVKICKKPAGGLSVSWGKRN